MKNNIDSQPDLLWHYTNLAGLLGIIEHQELWATDLRYLNDSTEFKYGLERVLAVLRQRDDRYGDVADLFEEIADAVETIIQAFVVCFSTHHDNLSLWRGYGHQGYALGFERDKLEQYFGVSPFVEIFPPRLQQIAYKQGLQESLVDAVLAQHRIEPDPDTDGGAANIPLIMHLYLLTGALKHPAFRDEGEIRLTFSRDIEDTGSDVKFREGKLGPTPYLPLPLTDSAGVFKEALLRKIVVGPTPYPSEAERGVRQFLETRGLRDVKVTSSEVPLRW